jgi:uncharacterized membrane protein (UPF0127 family)
VAAASHRLLGADGSVACERCVVADSFFTRLRGLLGRRELSRDEGLLIRPGSSIHTWFMRFPIDVVFLDRDLRVSPLVRRRRVGSRPEIV